MKNSFNGLPKWDHYRSHIIKISLCISLAFCLAIIDVEGSNFEIAPPDYGIEEENIFVVPPNTYRKPEEKKVPPAKIHIKKPEIIKEIITTIKDEEVKDLKPLKDDDNPLLAPAVAPPAPSIPEAAPIVDKAEDKVFDFAERMPLFGDCMKDELTTHEWTECSNRAILEYFANKLKYPQFARENKLEGTVVMRFVVNKY